jgi:hypothetical protein
MKKVQPQKNKYLEKEKELISTFKYYEYFSLTSNPTNDRFFFLLTDKNCTDNYLELGKKKLQGNL